MEIYANRLPSGDFAGQYRYTFDFSCGINCVELDEALKHVSGLGKFMSGVKNTRNYQNWLRESAGLKDVADYQNRRSCARYNSSMKDLFLSRGYRTGRFSGSGLTEQQAIDFLDQAGKLLPADIKNLYMWDSLLQRARERAPISPDRILK